MPFSHIIRYHKRAAGHCETIALNVAQKSQISLVLLYAQPFRVTGHFETSVANDPKWPWTYHPNDLEHRHIATTLSPIFHSISLYGQLFSCYTPFESSALKDPNVKLKLKTKTSKLFHMHIKATPWVPNFTPFRPTASCFWVTCTEWPPNDLQH